MKSLARVSGSIQRNGLKTTFQIGISFLRQRIRDLLIERYGNRIIDNFLAKLEDINSLDSAFDFAINWKFRGFHVIAPLQIKQEFLAFANFSLARIGKPKNIIEVGTDNGGTLFLFSQISGGNSNIISVDINHYSKNKLDLFRSFGVTSHARIYNICVNTKSIDEMALKELLPTKDPVDLLFIDADHTYEAVRHDFQIFSPLVRTGGIIGFHDITPGEGNGVPKFWGELKNNYSSVEFREKDYGWGGIGVIVKDGVGSHNTTSHNSKNI